jgi:AcrR family transcriptional regulator
VKPRGREAVVRALEDAARELFAERVPDDVSLREIADRAGVNFGLVYQYIGTKSQVMQAVYERAIAQAATRMAAAESLEEALDILFRSGDGSAARLVVWFALHEGENGTGFRASPALTVLTDLAERDARRRGVPLSHERAQVFAAFTMSVAVGWRLLGPIALASAGLDPAEADQHTDTVRRLVRRTVSDLTGGG